ncbi:UDP-glucose:glycoprotein glucosyltransferase isoform X2 [Physcomitrium patens]|uniref:UDP-glucose:glycoprotein glucosyltransferase n=1 Tax=Physcomitrium patens TaxID=3218 RepID=A0A2K1KUI1_PHYPA|nr:UDP-glucose:glycoprotein glucosyltransferase-like isoform X2 [Physcomitrium patens]PNR57406.1 hypothetical protein PHYPA_004400 [Physcomitrium patens]|eukprot:XP_024372023.1 UDP-glucose:glycoprotein glucosyltransferase-like isoform X2 [Physcomitrella patens]
MGSLWLYSVAVVGLLLCTSSGAHALGLAKSVNVSVRAKWEGTSLLLEAGELLAKERNDLYWRFLEQWLESDESAKIHTDKECVQHIEERGSSILGAPLSPLFRLSLSLRSASPRLVLYRQLASESLAVYNSVKKVEEKIPNEVVSDRWSIGKPPTASEGRCCWIDTGSEIFYDESEVFNWLQFSTESSVEEKPQPEVFEFDHIYPGSEYGDFTAILYGALGTPCFARLHSLLADASKHGFVKYIVRPVLSSGCEKDAEVCTRSGHGGPVNLGGYGIELALKNMEYKAIDDSEVKKGDNGEETRTEDLSQDVRGFIFSKLLDRKPELTGELLTFRDHLLSSGVADSMNVWELKDLGYQTTQRIIKASEPLKLMQEINQNFPNLVSSLSRMQINDTIKEEIMSNQRLLPAGKNLMAINGAILNIETIDLFSLIELVQGELSLASNILSLKIPEKFIRKFLLLPEASEQGAMRLDYRSDKHVHYLNNIEEDSRYKRWRSNLNELLMPVFPGQMRYVRKNLYHAVYVIDPATPKGMMAVEAFTMLYENNYPMRFGVILLSGNVLEKIVANGEDIISVESDGVSKDKNSETDLSLLIIRLFLFVKEEYGDKELALKFLSNLHAAWAGNFDGDEDVPVQRSHVVEAIMGILRHDQKASEGLKEQATAILDRFDSGSDYREVALDSTLFVYKLGLSNVYPALLMNGQVYGSSQVVHAAAQAMNEELPRLQEGVYYGAINLRTDILEKFLSEEGQPRYNPQIVAVPKEDRKYVGLAYPIAQKDPVLTRLQYLHHPGTEDNVKPVTHWLALDLNKKSGVRLLQQALQYLSDGSKKGRVGILHNLKASNILEPSLLIRVVMVVANTPSRRAKVVPFLQKLLTIKEVTDVLPDAQTEAETMKVVLTLAEEMGLKASSLEKAISSASAHSVLEKIEEEARFLSRLCGLKAGVEAVITNGRVFIQEHGNYFVKEDFSLLDNVEYEKRVKQVEELVDKVEWKDIESDDLTSEFLSTAIMGVSSAMSARTKSSESVRFELLKAEHSAIVNHIEESPIHVDAVIDPLSAIGQKLSPILVLLQEWMKPSMRICFNPMSSLADLPLKNFYRFVLPAKDSYTTDGNLTTGPYALFSNMPPSRTLTMNLDVPEPWLVEPVIAVHDLDNIVLEKLGDIRTMHAVYELEALVLTGHCFEKESKEPPRGLQLLLGTKEQPHMVDTIVMANLGYWQLKAAPGVWTLELAPGRSTEIYTLGGKNEGTDEGPTSKRIIISDFRGLPVRLEVVKKKGMENEKILDVERDEDKKSKRKKFEKNKFMKWASSWVGVGKGAKRIGSDGGKVIREGETINIFSVASGHLYERFLKIMMLSVMKNTNRPVKFWFIKNYLSPQFKGVIPHMAREYGFEYDLVTYKWPSWLHKQTEKQRIIWAYKILFLDVLFPLSLKKVIFVDADQIVRADMAELYDMDMDGKPLAYTPFCDNNKEMDGFRFWNQGFWKDHLRGKPYHISALYVVDLVKFRQSAAGDNLRVFYESLSKDPNSLSNLDQDLPNYAQHQVPIFSLPQQWLWCESWCGNATKSQAKTIDLCNNPMTKEPKLEGARRIVAEWPQLDQEARDFTARVQQVAPEMEPQPLSSVHVEEVLKFEEQDVARTKKDGSVSGSSVDKESAAEL